MRPSVIRKSQSGLQSAQWYIFYSLYIFLYLYFFSYLIVFTILYIYLALKNNLYVYWQYVVYKESCHHSWKPSTLWTGATSDKFLRTGWDGSNSFNHSRHTLVYDFVLCQCIDPETTSDNPYHKELSAAWTHDHPNCPAEIGKGTMVASDLEALFTPSWGKCTIRTSVPEATTSLRKMTGRHSSQLWLLRKFLRQREITLDLQVGSRFNDGHP